ncbi:MAG TPA: polysaccharide deacetylase family protein [Bacillota bacterium]|nr:polysaccharide deacetylase family protein [Bacillota bacterium]HPT86624.1 polysaccharide deacetylase family protein [Bacillota bacterium]
MMGIFLLGLGLILWSYAGWDAGVRLFSGKTIRQGNGPGKRVHLSFDDGPDPRYTPILLDILRQKNVPATFFVVGKRAAAAPDLIRMMREFGHEIGWHTYFHRHAYCLSPWRSMETMRRGKAELEEILGKQLRWFRPPWGASNVFQGWVAKRMGLQVVLWTANAQDWKFSTGKTEIIRRLQSRVKPNTIIVLHDAGGEPGAPGNMLEALPEVIDTLRAAGYEFVSLHEITGGKYGGH